MCLKKFLNFFRVVQDYLLRNSIGSIGSDIGFPIVNFNSIKFWLEASNAHDLLED